MRLLIATSVAGGLLLPLSACTPPPKASALRRENAQSDLLALRTAMPAIPDPLTLDAALTLALEHNLEVHIRQQEQAIEEERAGASRLQMLPRLEFSGERSYRSEPRAASSLSILTERESLEPSYSSEQNTMQFQVHALWSVLDFGLSYYQVRQAVNRTRVAELQTERVRQNLALDVIRAYWRAVVAQSAVESSQQMLEVARSRQEALERQIRSRTVSEAAGLEVQRDLLFLQMRLTAFERDAERAVAELSSLLGLMPGMRLRLEMPEIPTDLSTIEEEPETLERYALLHRPELAVQDMEELIQLDEVRKTLLRIFPNATLFGGPETDANRFLYENQWYTVGVRAAWDLLSVPRLLQQRKVAQAQADLIRERRLALAVGVLTQVHLARIEYREAAAQYELAKQLADVQERRLATARAQKREGEIDEGAILQIEAEALFENVRRLTQYAEAFAARARLENTLGLPVERIGRMDPLTVAAGASDGAADEPWVWHEPLPQERVNTEPVDPPNRTRTRRHEP